MAVTGNHYDGMSLRLRRSVSEVIGAAGCCKDRRAAGLGLYGALGSLSSAVVTLDEALGDVGRTLVEGARSGKLAAVEGPFVGGAVAAAVTALYWIERARTGLTLAVAEPLDSAQIVISGIAEPRRCAWLVRSRSILES